MSVLILGWEYPPFNSGGLGVATFYLALFLKKYLPELTIALPYKLPITNSPFKIIFAEEIASTNKNLIPGYIKLEEGKIPLKILSDMLAYGYRIYHQIKAKPPKLIHAHDWFTAPAGVYLKNKLKIPNVVHVHSTEIERTGGNPNDFIWKIEKDYFSQYDKIIPVSDLTKDILIKEYKIPESKIKVVTNGMLWEEFEGHHLPKYFEYLKYKGERIILFVGRLVLQKGPDFLLRSAPLVINKEPKTTFCFVGSGDMMPYLISLAASFNLSQKIHFTGFLRDKDLYGIYHAGDVLVVPSVFDPFGLVPLEGMLHGVPVICSKTTGVAYYLENIMKFDFWDINEIAHKILALLRYPTLKFEYYQNQIAEAKRKFSWEKSAAEIYKIYKELCPQL